jgi:nucleotide-binding universal stress UspA family protein
VVVRRKNGRRRRHDRPRVLRGYRRLLVPVLDDPESERAVELACRLAADRSATLVAVAVVEIPQLLPLDAHMVEEEAAARALLERAGATADAYGIRLSARIVRAREAADAIVELARSEHAELVVIGGSSRSKTSLVAGTLGATVRRVLETAPCRVLLVAPVPERLRARLVA